MLEIKPRQVGYFCRDLGFAATFSEFSGIQGDRERNEVSIEEKTGEYISLLSTPAEWAEEKKEKQILRDLAKNRTTFATGSTSKRVGDFRKSYRLNLWPFAMRIL